MATDLLSGPLSTIFSDPLYSDFRRNISEKFGAESLNLGGTEFYVLFHRALRLFSSSNKNYDTILHEFMSLTVSPSSLLSSLQDWHPRLVLGQLLGKYHALAPAPVKDFVGPYYTSGFDRNHKISKRLQRSVR